MEPAGQNAQQRLPFHPQQRRGPGGPGQWQVVGQGNQGQGAGRHRQGQGQPNQPQNSNQPQNQRSDRPQFNRSYRRRDPRERSQGFTGHISQPGSSQSSDSEIVDRPGLSQHTAHEAGIEQLGTATDAAPAFKEPSKFEPTPKTEPNFALEQKLQEYTRQRDELNRNIEQLHAELAGRAEVARLQKQLEQVQMQLSEEQKHRKELEAAYQGSQEIQQKLQADAREAEAQLQTSRGLLRERDAHIQQLGEQLNHKDQQLRDSQEQSNEAAWRNDNALRDQESQIRALRKEKEEAIAEGNARHQMIERQTSSIASLERQLQESAQKLEEKDEQIQQHQEAVWAKDEHFHEQESRWKAQMQEMETFHMNNGRAITDQLNHLWHEHQLLVKQSEDFKLFHHDTVHKLQKQLAEKQSAGPVKMGPVPKGVPNGAPPPGRSEAGPGVSRHAETSGAPPMLPPGVPPSILPSAQTPNLPQTSRTIQPIHPASKPQTSQPVQPPNLQTPTLQGQHQQGLLRRAVEPQPPLVTPNPPTNPPPQTQPPKQPPPNFPRQAEPYRQPETASPQPQDNPKPAGPPQNPKPQPGKLLDEETLMRIFVEMIPEREEDAWVIGTTLANKLSLKLAPTHWKNYKKDHGTLKEFLVAHPEAFRLTADEKVYLTPEAQQKRGTPPTGPSGRDPPSGSPTPQEASRAAAQNAPGGPNNEFTAKGGSAPQFGTAVAVTPIATNSNAQKQRQQRQQPGGGRSESGGSNSRPQEPPVAANGRGGRTSSYRGAGSSGGRGGGGQTNRPSSNASSASSNGNSPSGNGPQNMGGGVKNGPRSEGQNGPQQGGTPHGGNANGPSVNGGNVYSHPNAANGAPARTGGSARQTGPKGPPSNPQQSKPLYVPKGSTGPPKETEKAKA